MYYLTVFISAFILFFILTPGIIGKIPAKGDKFTVAIVHAIVFSIIFSIVSIFFKNLGKYKEGASPQFCEKVVTSCSTTGGGGCKTECDRGKCTTKCNPIKTTCSTQSGQRDTSVCKGTYGSCDRQSGRWVCRNSAGVVGPLGGMGALATPKSLSDGTICAQDGECKKDWCSNFLCRECAVDAHCQELGQNRTCSKVKEGGVGSSDINVCK